MNPAFLYHGSRFEQAELKPGFQHSNELVHWDHTESNKFLYACTVESLAVELGFASSIEKQFKIDRFHVTDKKILIQTDEKITVKDLERVPMFLYIIRFHADDGWVKNDNKHNGINTEYKTKETIYDIDRCKAIKAKDWLSHYDVTITRSAPPKVEGASKQVMESYPAYVQW